MKSEGHTQSHPHSRVKHSAIPEWRRKGIPGYTPDEYKEALRNGSVKEQLKELYKKIEKETGIQAPDLDSPRPVANRQFIPFVKQITSDIRIRFTQRCDDETAELIVEDNYGVPKRVPDNIEMVSCATGFRLPIEDLDSVHHWCVYRFSKESRYVIRDIFTRRVLCQLGFKWDVRRL